MTTEQLNIILKHLYEKKDATIILSNGSYLCFNPQIACPYIRGQPPSSRRRILGLKSKILSQYLTLT